MKEIALYMHGGSENHGCEAIVRSTVKIIDCPAILYSRHPYMEEKYHVSEVCEIRERGKRLKRFSPQWFIKQAKKRIGKDSLAFIRDAYCNVISESSSDRLYMSIGGDNYCGVLVPALQYTNRMLTENGMKTVLWGCSIDPSYMKKPENVADLIRYTRIFAREKITYEALLAAGLGDIARHYPDPAFTLGAEKCKLPPIFQERKIVGINISPYVQKNGSKNLVFENYERLITDILKETNYGVALIPHVIWSESDDRVPIRAIYEKFKSTGRVVYIGDHNCCRLKYCISQCELLVTARTHASIAAYSTCVPTLVVGYSMKSRGIAEDLFGTTEHYVVNAWDMHNDAVLTNAFRWLDKHKDEIRRTLQTIMPDYIQRAYAAGEEIRQLMRTSENV